MDAQDLYDSFIEEFKFKQKLQELYNKGINELLGIVKEEKQ